MNIYDSLLIAITITAEAFIAFLYADYLYTEKCSPLKRNLIYIAGHVFMFMVYFLFSSAVVNAVTHFAVLFVIFITVYCKQSSALFCSAVLTALMMLSEVVSYSIFNVRADNISSYTGNIVPFLSFTILSKLLYLVFCIIGSRALEPHKFSENGGKSLFMLSIMPIASACTAVTVLYIYLNIDTPYPLQIAGSVCMCALLFANIYTVSVYNRSEKVNRENLSLKLAMQKDEYDAEYYKMLDEQYERQRILVHDVKNHMQAINGLATEGKAEEIQRYIENWGCDKALQKQVRYCHNAILNIIIAEVTHDCSESGIVFNCDIRDKSVDFIDDTDISALFGNLLSNAFEAAKDSEEKLIELYIKIKPDQKTTSIKISNSCKGPPVKNERGLFVSHKEDKEKHGLGQKSIKRIIKKYGGTSETYYDDDEKRFEMLIVFSMQQ